MASPIDLSTSLQRMGLAQRELNYHELKIEYPVLDLLPADNTATPTLAPPAHRGFREKPDSSKYHLNLSGTDYIVRLPLESGSSPLQLVPLERPSVFTTLIGLLVTPGRSWLQFATYFDREQGERYRFRLSTERHDGQVEVVAETELSRPAWAVEKSSFRRETWMRLVRDLLIRYSDRAYWHVHERLKGYRWYLKQAADEDWDWEDGFNSIQFFGKQFSMDARPRPGEDGGSYEDEWYVHLPCAHQQVMTFRQLQTMTAGECLRSRCGTCDLPVVKDDNPFRDWLTLHRGRERRARFSAREGNWHRLDEEFPLGNRRVSIRTGLLCKALQHAKSSILPPRSASPRSLPMEGYGDALKILEQFSTQLGGMDDEIACTSAELYEELLRKLDRAVGRVEASGHESGNLERLPAGWFALWRLMLMRAAQLVAMPGYDGSRLAALVGEDGPAGDDLAEDDAEMGELEAEMRHAQLEESD